MTRIIRTTHPTTDARGLPGDTAGPRRSRLAVRN